MAGRIPQNFVDDVLNRIDIVDIIDAYVPLRKTGKNYSGLCPFHQEKTPSFTVNPDKQFYYCFGCGAGGNVISFMMDYQHSGFTETIELLAARVGLTIPAEASNTPQENYQPLYEVMEEATEFFIRQLIQPAGAKALNYLQQRGINAATIKHFRLGYAPASWDTLLKTLDPQQQRLQLLLHSGLIIQGSKGSCYDRFRDRVIFPIRDQRGRVVGFGGRVLTDEQPKYLNSPETSIFHKAKELYGLYEARKAQATLPYLLVVEGYMDVVSLVQHQILTAVATLGTATSKFHIERLFQHSSDIVFCFDGDQAGRKAAWRALQIVLPLAQDSKTIKFLFLPEGEDPDSLVQRQGTQGFEQHLQQAVPLSDFFFNSLLQQTNLQSDEGKARLAYLANSYLEKLPHNTFRELMQQRLSQLIGLAAVNTSRAPSFNKAPLSAKQPIRSVLGNKLPLSLAHQAIAQLLHNPQLAKEINTPEALLAISLPDIEALVALLTLLQQQPNITTGTLLSYWHDNALGELYRQLIAKPLSLPDTEIALVQQFKDIMSHLYRLKWQQKTEQLLNKARAQPLTAEEKHQLQQALLRAKDPLTS